MTGLLHAGAALACYLRSAATGSDLSAYNTTENAADFADLRKALGIRRWNVFGVSYGTNLALTLMREYPEGIRSVIIDSVEPPSVVNVGKFWGNASKGFDNLFRACAEQPSCWTRQPGLAETFTALVRKLESNPVTTSVTSIVGQPPTKVVIDGGALVNWLVNMSFATEDYPHVPAWIGELADGHAENIALSIAKPVLATPAGYIGYGLTTESSVVSGFPTRANPTCSCWDGSLPRTILPPCSGRPSTSTMCMTTAAIGTSPRRPLRNAPLRAVPFQP